jgi:hypothetical protein
MRPLWLAAFCFTSSACSSANNETAISVIGSPSPDPAVARDAQVAIIYNLVKKHDEAGLLKLAYPFASGTALSSPTVTASTDSMSPHAQGATGSAIPSAAPSPTKSIDPAVALSLFMLDRQRYRDLFVAAYPRSLDGVNGDFGYRLDRAALDPRGSEFPILAISGLATGGDDEARKAMLNAIPFATGRLADLYAAEAARVLTSVPANDAITDLATLPSQLRVAAVSEIDWCDRKPDAILAANPQPLPSEASQRIGGTNPTPAGNATAGPIMVEALVQQQIRQSLKMCDFVSARERDERIAADRRRRSLSKKRGHKHAPAKKAKKTPNA